MISRYLTQVFTILILISCNSKQKNDAIKGLPHPTLPYRIDIEENINNLKTIPISTFGRKLRYVPLETSKQCLIKRINQIEFSPNFIFISDFEKLLQFDKNGRFIRQVGSNGRGPGEYIYVSSFCIDENQEKTYILAWGIYSVLEFDFNGRFLRSFKIPFETLQLLTSDVNNFIFVVPNGPANPDSGYRLIVTDSTGKEKIKIKNYNRFVKKHGLFATKIPMYFYKDTIRILESRVDTLNAFNQNKHIPYAIFNLGQTKMEPDISFESEEVADRNKDKLWVWTITENNEYLFIGFNLGMSDSTRRAIFNKFSSETVFLNNNGFKNDMGVNIPFWPKYVYHDTVLVDYQEAYKILNAAKNTLKNTKTFETTELIKTLSETSNPVLIICE